MQWLRRWIRGGLALFQKRKLEAEMDEEIRLHLELRTLANTKGGMDPETARWAARRQFGALESIKEACREQRGLIGLENCAKDIRFGLRALAKQPLPSLISLTVVAFGIAGATTVFGLFNGLILRPFPVPHQEHLVDLSEYDPSSGAEFLVPSYSRFCSWRDHNQTLDAIATCSFWASDLSISNQAHRVDIVNVSCDLFDVLGVQPILGKRFTAEEDRVGGPSVVLLSFRLWERVFGKDPTIIGQVIRLDGDPFTILGVLPPEAAFPFERDIWRPLAADPAKGAGGFAGPVVARLKKGVTPKQAAEDLKRIQKSWAEQHPEAKLSTLPTVIPFRERYLWPYKFGLSVLLAMLGFVLLIACSTVASIMLARGVQGSRGIALRIALGATRSRIMQQILSESLILCTLAGLVGVVLGYGALRAVLVAVAQEVPSWLKFSLDARCFLFCAGLVVGTALLSGLLPSLQAASLKDLARLLQAAGAGLTGSRHLSRTLSTIVVVQITLACTLLIGASLLTRTLLRVKGVELGFRPEHVLTYHIPLPIGPYFDQNRRRLFFQEHLDKVRSLPGVQCAALCSALPLTFHAGGQDFEVEGEGQRPQSEGPVFQYSITSGYFETMSIRLQEGRTFTEWDNRAQSEPTAIVDESFAKRHWPAGSALGKRLRVRGSSEWMRIVGVVHEVVNLSLDQASCASVYIPYAKDTPFFTGAVARVAGDPSPVVAAIRKAITELDASVPLQDVQMMTERVHRSLWARRILAWLAGVPAAAAAIMAFGGIFGIVSYSVSRQTRDIGIRLALGAQQGVIRGMILKQATKIASTGLILGLSAAILLNRFLKYLLYDLSSTDPVTYLIVSLSMLIIVLLGCSVPAWRAARTAPMMALRCE